MLQHNVCSASQRRLAPRRLTAHKLAVCGSKMPGAAEGFSLGPDNVCFRRRLRHVHPETVDAMRGQRQACVEVRSVPTGNMLFVVDLPLRVVISGVAQAAVIVPPGMARNIHAMLTFACGFPTRTRLFLYVFNPDTVPLLVLHGLCKVQHVRESEIP